MNGGIIIMDRVITHHGEAGAGAWVGVAIGVDLLIPSILNQSGPIFLILNRG